MFGPDIEGLLPMHYYAERHDKDMHLDLMQFVLQVMFVNIHRRRCLFLVSGH